MTRPWTTLAKVDTAEGLLELRQRGDGDFLIVIGGRVLMNSVSRSSEEELSRLALTGITARSKVPRVLVAGLGMGFTLRAALDALPPSARVTVCEINRVVVDWCRGPLAAATRDALADPRVDLQLVDVAAVIARSPRGTFDAIVLDLYEGPNAASQRRDDPFYSPRAIAEQRAALAGSGVLAVWSEDADAPYAKRLQGGGFEVTTHSIRAGSAGGGRRHIVYVSRPIALAPQGRPSGAPETNKRARDGASDPEKRSRTGAPPASKRRR